jgi:type IX secretion system PorP/SprF family membrane protein
LLCFFTYLEQYSGGRPQPFLGCLHLIVKKPRLFVKNKAARANFYIFIIALERFSMIRRILSLIVLLNLAALGYTQDVHFSQFYAQPLLLNPALTGLTPCTYRASISYRNQWGSVVGPSSYQTYAVAFDAGLLKGKLNNSILGVGVNFYNDKSGDGALTNLSGMLSIAYHQALGSDNHYLSAGFQTAFVQKRVDQDKFIFEDQIDQNGVIPGATTADILDDGQFGYADFNAGFHWRSNFTDRFQMYAGGAYMHIGEPEESFLGDNSNVLNSRLVVHGGMKVGLSATTVLLPTVLYMNQTEGSNTELLYGSSLGFLLSDGTANFYIGAYYRDGDAIIAATSIDFKNFQFGISYDVNVSDLQTVSGSKGGIELSLQYFGCIETTPREKRPVDCPRF